MDKQKLSIYGKSILTIIPASLLGIIAMVFHEIPSIIWLQNMIAMFIFGMIAFFLIGRKIKANYMLIVSISIILLLLTLLGNGMSGVHRWIRLVIISVNVAMIVIPITLVAIYHLLKNNKGRYALTVMISTAIILLIQPDASQLTGFAIPVIVILLSTKINKIIKYLVSIVLTGLMIFSWIFIDKLEPVSYVEEILGLLNQMSGLWFVLGIASLILIPVPFLLFPPVKFRLLSICIGLYYSIIILSTTIGNFPVPFMGYGISPIIGYWIVFLWYVKSKCCSSFDSSLT